MGPCEVCQTQSGSPLHFGQVRRFVGGGFCLRRSCSKTIPAMTAVGISIHTSIEKTAFPMESSTG
jgi:hypothetical protein